MRSRAPLRPCHWGVLLLLLAALLPPGRAAAQEPASEKPARVEAAFLRNFARYVNWPAHAFAGERSPWFVCILGDSHFDDDLEATLRGRQEQGRSFEVVRVARLDQLPACQIVFVDFAQASLRRAALAALKRQPVLTVGHASEFLDEGGIIRLVAGERIEMSINLDQARAAALTIPSKMLEVSREVLENGAVRRLR
ncbi:MAG: YfiR family protein [Burkholderiales bacterium]|nr:YfiR family protein [Burkholderiales bacterium]